MRKLFQKKKIVVSSRCLPGELSELDEWRYEVKREFQLSTMFKQDQAESVRLTKLYHAIQKVGQNMYFRKYGEFSQRFNKV